MQGIQLALLLLKFCNLTRGLTHPFAHLIQRLSYVPTLLVYRRAELLCLGFGTIDASRCLLQLRRGKVYHHYCLRNQIALVGQGIVADRVGPRLQGVRQVHLQAPDLRPHLFELSSILTK
ncbi:hypothetical protein ASE12_04340 [Aeromicrobium sp. Root236]|nr:hypothetical protein ASE12_04340 [Aeromicrobium sp. Root236]